MADVKDILGVPRSGGPKQEAKKEKEKVQRPAGMSREAFALLDASHPIVPSFAGDLRKKSDLQGLKEKRKAHKGVVSFSLPLNCHDLHSLCHYLAILNSRHVCVHYGAHCSSVLTAQTSCTSFICQKGPSFTMFYKAQQGLRTISEKV